MTIHNDLDVQATAFWLEVPEHPQQGVVYAGNQRPFETVRNGVRYVMKQLPAHQRGTAQITTDYGMNYDIRDIESAYAALSPPSSGAVGKGEAGAFQAGPFDPSSFEVAAEQIAASQPPGLNAAVRATTELSTPIVQPDTPLGPMVSGQKVTLDRTVTRATIDIIPTLYSSDPANRIVVYNHITVNLDSDAFREFDAKMGELIGLMRQSNEIAGETRDKLIAEITAGIAILKSPKPDPKMVELLLKRPLVFIAEKAGGAVISVVAVAVLALLGKVTGMW